MQANSIRSMLQKSIQIIEEGIQQFVWHPGDLSRHRKLPPALLLLYLLTAGCRSSVTELRKLYAGLKDMPVPSALSAARAKLKPEALQELFRLFNAALDRRGGRPPKWRFIFVDGTRFSCADRNRSERSYDDWRHQSGGKHLEAEITVAYDGRKRRIIDAVIQPLHKINERAALCQIIDREEPSPGTQTCIVADRGFPSWNVLGHAVEKGVFFLIRTTEAEAATSILKQLGLPEDDEYDITVKVRLVRRRSMMKETVEGYTNVLLNSNTDFDYIAPRSGEEYCVSFRVVRHKTDDKQIVTVVTNLPVKEFSTRKIAQLYRERWNIEIAFGKLKGALAMESFHTNRPALMEQEVWAKLTAFNYVSAIQRAADILAHQRDRARAVPLKHHYEVDFTFACTAALGFLNPVSELSREENLIAEVSRKRHAVDRKRNNPARGNTRRRTPIPNTHRSAI